MKNNKKEPAGEGRLWERGEKGMWVRIESDNGQVKEVRTLELDADQTQRLENFLDSLTDED